MRLISLTLWWGFELLLLKHMGLKYIPGDPDMLEYMFYNDFKDSWRFAPKTMKMKRIFTKRSSEK